MPTIIIDFETRATIDLNKCGAYVYAAHPDTEILMMGYKIDDHPVQMWWPGDKMPNLEHRGWKVVAHNAEFEMCMWREIMHKRLGYPDIPLKNWDDTAARAAMCALPRSLDGVCKALGLAHQKDDEGHRLMLQMCKPKRLTKKQMIELAEEIGWLPERVEDHMLWVLKRLASDPEYPHTWQNEKTGPYYHRFYRWKEDQASMQRLAEYCTKDVEAEHELHKVLPPLPAKERRIWELDRKINDRGIKVDIPAVKNIIATLQKHEEKLNGRLRKLTNGTVATAKSSAALAEALDLPNVQKTTISDALQVQTCPRIREILSIRQSLGQSSVAKFQSLLSATDPRDWRIRGLLLYHGAATGRWSGRLFQPHNLPRGNQDRYENPDDIIEMFSLRDPEIIETIWGDPVEAASNCLRGMMTAEDGRLLMAADFASIEGRGLAWVAGEEHVLEGYRQGLDPYKVDASTIYRCAYEKIDKKQRQVGKVANLSGGYGGGVAAMKRFGADRLGFTDKELQEIVTKWRGGRPATVALWAGLDEAAMKAVIYGVQTQYRNISFGMNGPFLCMKLPSGRLLRYYNPKISTVQTPWGSEREAVTVMSVDSLTKKWVRRPMHGGLWTENAIQALCRDLLAEAILRLEDFNYHVVLHVHDEAVVEHSDRAEFGVEERYRDFFTIMKQVPSWAGGFPIDASGWTDKRYKKD